MSPSATDLPNSCRRLWTGVGIRSRMTEKDAKAMTDSIELRRRPCEWGGIFDAPPLGSTARFCGNGAAVFSDDDEEKFRYALACCWDYNLPLWLWVMLNPSKATERQDDPTIDRCLGFTRRLSGQEAGGLVVVNLCARCAGNSKDIDLCSDFDVGPNNDEWIRLILKSGHISRIIAAWRDDGHFTSRRMTVVRLLREETKNKNIPFFQIGDSTKRGAPRHPSPRAQRWLPKDAPTGSNFREAGCSRQPHRCASVTATTPPPLHRRQATRRKIIPALLLKFPYGAFAARKERPRPAHPVESGRREKENYAFQNRRPRSENISGEKWQIRQKNML